MHSSKKKYSASIYGVFRKMKHLKIRFQNILLTLRNCTLAARPRWKMSPMPMMRSDSRCGRSGESPRIALLYCRHSTTTTNPVNKHSSTDFRRSAVSRSRPSTPIPPRSPEIKNLFKFESSTDNMSITTQRPAVEGHSPTTDSSL